MSTAPRRVVFLGPPGSGKGSYSKRCAPQLGVPHLSTGDMLRQEVERGTALGRRIASHLREGRMVGDDVVLGASGAPAGAAFASPLLAAPQRGAEVPGST